MRCIETAILAALAFGLLSASAPADEPAIRNCDVMRSEFDVDYAAAAPLEPVEIAGTPNGQFSGKVVLYSRAPIKGVSAKMSDLVSKAGAKIPASEVDVRYGLPSDDPVMDFDALGAGAPAEMPVLNKRAFGRLWPSTGPAMGWAVQPVWVLVRVPADAKGGDYEGTLSVSAEGKHFSVPVKLRVSGFRLPDPRDFRTFGELIESPESVAMQYGAPLWSDRHLALVEKSLTLAGWVGTRTAYIPLIAETNMGNAETMVRWTPKGGAYSFDFTPMEKFLDSVEKTEGKPRFVVLYVWDAFLEGAMNEEVLKHEPLATQQDRSESAGQGPTVTEMDDAGKTQPLQLPQYSDKAKSLALWKPLVAELMSRLKKRGLDKSVVLGIVTDVQPAASVADFWKELLPGSPWMRRGHMRIQNVSGVTLAFQEGPSYNQWSYDTAPPNRLYGWQGRKWPYPGLSIHFPRDMRDYFARCRWRQLGEVNIAGAQCGFGGLGCDFWNVLKDRRGRAVGRISEGRYPKSNWRNLNILTTLTAPSPDGAIPTARLVLLREGLQECEARIRVEEAILSGKLKGDAAAKDQALLDERVKAMTDGIGKFAYGGHWSTQKCEFPAFIDGGWQERSRKLFDAAAEVGNR